MTMPDQDAWSYSGDPGGSDKDAVRFYLQDVDPTVRLLADTEIAFLLGQWKDRYGSLIYVASVAAEIISFKFAGVVAVSADDVAVGLDKISPAYAQLAVQLRGMYDREQVGGEVPIDNLMWNYAGDAGVAPTRFGIGDMDNPAAGQQDYGGAPRWWLYEDAWRG